jgi:hypothetical protein
MTKAKARAGELREEMARASQEIAKDPARMRAAEREGIAPQVRNFVRKAEQEHGRQKGRGSRRTKGLSGENPPPVDRAAALLYCNVYRTIAHV